jgi:hypothetical protein
MIKNQQEAYQLLELLGAEKRLLTHAKLVSEAVEVLLKTVEQLGVEMDSNLVRLGTALHDAGKIRYPNELNEPGHQHEPAGEQLLIEKGVQKEIARFCLSHARWQQIPCSLEELLVALAYQLWKGKRIEELELKVIDEITKRLRQDRWKLFLPLDNCFESIASKGAERLINSQ